MLHSLGMLQKGKEEGLNKVGMDVCSEIINNYLERPERNISRLMDYARTLRVCTTLEKYLEVKL